MTMLGRGGVHRLVAALLGFIDPPKRIRSIPAEKVWLVGHRGAALDAPENTIESFERALALGADGVETDVLITKDREFVLWHDPNPNGKVALLRQIGAEKLKVVPKVPPIGSPWRKAVRELTLAQMREHYGYVPRGEDESKSRDEGQRVPFVLLRDLFEWMRRSGRPVRAYLDVKLEEDQTEEALLLLRTLREFLSSAGSGNGLSFHLLSPQLEIVRALQRGEDAAPPTKEIRIYADFELPGVLEFARRLQVRCVGMGKRGRSWASYRRELAQVLAARGSGGPQGPPPSLPANVSSRASGQRRAGVLDLLLAWTINDPKELRNLIAMGTPAILTDELARLRRMVDERAGNRESGTGNRR